MSGTKADWVRSLTNFRTRIADFFNDKCRLIEAFPWGPTPQGFLYWLDLYDAVSKEDQKQAVADTLIKLGLLDLVPPEYFPNLMPENLLWE